MLAGEADTQRGVCAARRFPCLATVRVPMTREVQVRSAGARRAMRKTAALSVREPRHGVCQQRASSVPAVCQLVLRARGGLGLMRAARTWGQL